MSAYTYAYTGVNPLVQSLTRPNGSVTTYQYNGLNQLTEISNKTSTNDVLNQHVFTYNNQDLRGSETISGSELPAMPSLPEETVDYAYNTINQLLSVTNPNLTFVYDDDGNMIQGYTPDGYVFTADYDAEDRMTSLEYTDSGSIVHRTEYRYSGDGFLAVIRKFENSSLIDEIRIVRDGLLAIQDRDENNTVEKEYTWGLNLGGGIGGLLNLKQGGQDYAYLYDGKGNVAAIIDSTQAVVAAYRYAPFGEPLAQTGSLTQPFGFSTKRYDEQTGLIYYGYRFYGPAIGRWTTRDPLGEAGGMNLYAFVGNNPVNWVDPWGLSYNDYLKIIDTFTESVENMTKDQKRHSNPYMNNFLRTFHIMSGGEMSGCIPSIGCGPITIPPYLGCGEQWIALKQELEKNTYDDHWKFKYIPTKSLIFYHEVGEAISDNPKDPKLILDPWKGIIEVVQPGEDHSTHFNPIRK